MLEIVIHSTALVLALLVTIILLFNFRRNPFINIFILLIILSNLVRIPFYLSYALDWQSVYRDVPKPFSIMFLMNTVFFYHYLKSMLLNAKFQWIQFIAPTVVVIALFMLNWLVPSNDLYQIVLRGLNFPIVVGFVVFYVVSSWKVLFPNLWNASTRNIHYSNFYLIRNWLTALFILFVLLAIRLIGSYTYELITQQKFNNLSFHSVHSILWIIIYITFFSQPTVLYGLQRIDLFSNSEVKDVDDLLKAKFSWRRFPSEIQNKMDQQLSIKLDPKVPEIIRKLESKMAIKVMVKNPNVNIEALSDKLELPKSHVQYVFKYYADFSFVEFRSKIRVYYAVSKMQQGFLSKNTMDALAKESGFSSYNPFYAAFKSEFGTGPSEFNLQLKQVLNKG